MPVQLRNETRMKTAVQQCYSLHHATNLLTWCDRVTSGSVHLDLTTQESDAAEKGLEDLSVARTRCLEGGGIMRAWSQN